MGDRRGRGLLAGGLRTVCGRDRPRTSPEHAAAIDDAYFPWIGAVNSLLDSVVDRQEDDATGQHRLLDYYTSPEHITERLELITTQAMARARELQPRHGHTLMVAAITSFYLSNPATQAPDLYALRSHLRKSVGYWTHRRCSSCAPAAQRTLSLAERRQL